VTDGTRCEDLARLYEIEQGRFVFLVGSMQGKEVLGCELVSFATELERPEFEDANAIVNASNKIRLGNDNVTVIEGSVPFTASSDKTKKEKFEPVDGEQALGKIRGFELTSWNFIGHDPKQFRHYGPMAQDFFGAFGHDGVGQIGTETTINSGDIAGILMIAVQALEKRTAELKQKEAQIAVLQSEVKDLKAKHAYFEAVAARLERLKLQKNPSIQITAER
jgi:hypothetical protein